MVEMPEIVVGDVLSLACISSTVPSPILCRKHIREHRGHYSAALKQFSCPICHCAHNIYTNHIIRLG